jgi:hypothetical protein
MANLRFKKSVNSPDEEFFFLLQIEIVKIFSYLEDVFSDFFKGTFEITVDEDEPSIEYFETPDEEPDKDTLGSHLIFLDKSLHEASEKIKKNRRIR